MNAEVFSPARLRDVVLPREHGSWSLAFEPVALGLCAVPSRSGVLLAAATAAVFLTRRPLQLVARAQPDAAEGRREGAIHALVGGALLALTFGALAVGDRGLAPLWPLVLALLPAALFVHFDRGGETRTLAAELAGVGAFSCLPAAVALLGGADVATAFALSAVAAARSLPTVLTLRTYLRGRKTAGAARWPAALTAVAAAAGVTALAFAGRAPWLVAGASLLLAARTLWLLGPNAPAWRASRLGLFEAVVGAGYAVAGGLAFAVG